MAAGSLNRRVRLQHPQQRENPANEADLEWVEFASAWASIRHTSGLKALIAGADRPIVRASVRLRYRRDVSMGMRLVHGDDHYVVEAVLPDEDRREYVDLVCRLLSPREVESDEAGP
ncbi:head-tail adaptor protein [Bordetella genomosp. 10]|uniref:Head-tail adaptor protein n=1 Tax=Bordetella genomosp. 10 TaxID=1416804 RepID=A0A261S6C2_9BORD|nr:head-tail adaptor protein [Bordetella genomosp. 10]